MNAMADAKEGVGWLKTKPLVALVPLLWAAVGVAAIATRDQKETS
jgi:hypothetical protein